jgi:UDP-galactose transporter
MYKQLIDEPIVIAKLMIPAAIYTIQNILQFIAIENLNPGAFQVLYQMKLLTTAAVSFFMLHKQLTIRQWGSLGVLVAGVSLVQLAQSPSESAKESNLLGLITVFVACWLSAFSSVYFEKVLKSSKGSVWVRNVQLAMLGLVLGFGTVYTYDREEVLQKGFFHGYTSMVWWVTALQATGGLIVAVVVKYADNMMKNIATSVSIVLSAVVCLFLPQLAFDLSYHFVVGAAIVICASSVYSSEATFTVHKGLRHQHKSDDDIEQGHARKRMLASA